MEERDQILIDRYLAGELSDAELLDFDRRRSEDPAFHEEVSTMEEARLALKIKQRKDLKEHFRKRDEFLDKIKPETPALEKHRFTWIWIALALLCGLLIWRLLRSDTKENLPVETGPTDTSRYEKTPVVRIDTIDQKDSLHQQSPEETLRPQKQDMAAKTKKGQALFAEYYRPYKDALMDPTTRGDEELNTLQQFQKAYWESDFNNAARLFLQIPVQSRSNDNYRFMYASSLLANGDPDQAIPIFSEIVRQKKSRYQTESLYALALAHVTKNDPATAIGWLDQYIKVDKAKQKEQALSLEKVLKDILKK